ncbi:unnamed protein product [Paramecium sonneborni]|uniref:Uncharacterized protein n=1 Tax=Paramecium sonneborni TaxID=65129 RepID=A0A8S1QYP0_9CILI|nr:unnamed protein product [Paramecium sonneborni]
MDRSNSIPHSNSQRYIPQSQPSLYRQTVAPPEFSNSQVKFMNDLILQQPPSQRQALNKQLEQLKPEEIREIQSKLENGEVLHGLPQLPEGANMTHKFIVKVRKHNQPNQYQQPPILQPSQSPQPKNIISSCPDCINHLKKLKEQDQRIESLLIEMNRMSQFLIDKGKEIDLWKLQYRQIQNELSKPKPFNNQDQIEIEDLKRKLHQKEYENQLQETTIKQLKENQNQNQNQNQNDEDFELRAPNNDQDIDQLQKQLFDALQDNEILKQDNDRLTSKLEKLQNEFNNKKSEIKTIYKPDLDTDKQLKELQQKYSMLQSQFYILQEKSQNSQKEIQYETKVIYQSDPDIEKKLQELQSRYTLLQSQFYSLQETSKIMQKEISYENKIIYQNDPETELLLQKKNKQYDELNTRYQLIQDQLQIYQEKLKQQTMFETKTIYKTDPEIERQLQFKIDQYNQLQSRFNQLQSQYFHLEQKSQVVQKEFIIDPELERLLKVKSQQLETMTTKCTFLQEQIEKLQIQIETYQTKIYQSEIRKSDTENYLLQIESLEEQLRRQNAEIELQNRKIYQFELNNEQEQIIKKQFNDVKALYEQELSLNEQLKRKIEELKIFKQQVDTLQLRIQELEQILFQKEDRIKQLSLESNQQKSEIANWQQRISAVSINMENSNNLKEQIQMWKDKYEKLEEKQNLIIDQEINQYKLKYEQMEQRYLSLQQSYETIQITLRDYKDNEQNEVFKMEIKRLQKTVIELRSEIDRLLVQASDNQWLQKRYEEQQLLIENYKTQIEQKQQIQKEYIYHIDKSEIKNQRFIDQQSLQQINIDQQLINPSSNLQQMKIQEVNPNQTRMSEYNHFSSRPIELNNSKFTTSYSQTQFLQPSININDIQKQNKVDEGFNIQKWNNNYELVVEEVKKTDKYN